MGEYRLSLRAKSDVLAIYEYTYTTFGSVQAASYHAELERSFALLADFPHMGRRADHILPGVRRFSCQAHVVYYSTDANGLLVRAILHAAMDAPDPGDL